MYYQFQITDGKFAGSGVFPIRNALFDFTEVPFTEDEEEKCYWDGEVWADEPHAHEPAPESDWLPALPVPASVPMHKFRGQLILDGHDPDNIRAMLAQETDPVVKLLNLNEWDKAEIVYRAHALVEGIGPLLGYDTPTKLDDFFRRAQHYKHPGVQ